MLPPIRRIGGKTASVPGTSPGRGGAVANTAKVGLGTATPTDAEEGGEEKVPGPATLSPAPYEATRAERLTHWLRKEGFPPSYTEISPAEESIFKATRRFQSHFHEYFPKRAPQLLAPLNECRTRKMICTFIRPTIFPFDELFDVGSCARFLAGYMRYEILEDTERLPEVVVSPATTLQWQIGNCFELSILLTSLLVGVGYNAYVVVGYAERAVCENDSSQREWTDEYGELSTSGKSKSKRRTSNKDSTYCSNVVGTTGGREENANTKAPVTDDYCCYVDSDADDDGSDMVDAEYAALVKDRLVLRPADEIDMYSQYHHQQDDDKDTRSNTSFAGSRVQGASESYANSVSLCSPLANNVVGATSPLCGPNTSFNAFNNPARCGNADAASVIGGDDAVKGPAKGESVNFPPVRRLHSWVLVLPGGRKSVREPVFVEPSRGDLIAPGDADSFYTGVEGVFNGDNYFVNLTPDAAVSSLVPDLQDASQWEAVLFELDVEDERNISHNFVGTPLSTLGGQVHLGATPGSGGGVLSASPSAVYGSRGLGNSAGMRRRYNDEGSPAQHPGSTFSGGFSTLAGGLTHLMQTTRDRAVHFCCASWVEELTLNRAQYESRYPGGMKFTRYVNADVFRYAAYLMPDHRVLEVYLPDTQYPSQAQIHLLFEHRADKLRRRSVYPTASAFMRRTNSVSDFRSGAAAASGGEGLVALPAAEGEGKEPYDTDYDYSSGAQQRAGLRRNIVTSALDDEFRETNVGKRRSFVRHRSFSSGAFMRERTVSNSNSQLIPLVDVVVQSGNFRLMQEWFERGRMLQTSVGGLRLLTYEPGVQRTMTFYWDARNDGLWRRQEFFYESRALRKVKEFYRGRDDRLWYRSATFDNVAALNMGYNLSHTNSQQVGSSPSTKGSVRGADDTQRAEPIRMSEKYHRNETIPPDDDVAKYVFVRPAAVAAARAATGTMHPQLVASAALSPVCAGPSTGSVGSLSEGGEMWVYFHYRPGSIIRPYRMYPKTDPGEECLLSAVAGPKGSISGTLPSIIVMMPNATPPSDMEQCNERNRLRWWVTMCQGRVRASLAECNAIVESTREPSGPVAGPDEAEAAKRSSVELGGLAGAQLTPVAEQKSQAQNQEYLLPGLCPSKRVALANEKQRRVPAVVSVFDTLRNRPRETEAERRRRLAEEALREEARCDYLAPYIAKLDLPTTFSGDYMNVALTMDQARRVRDEALRELKERLIHRGRIIQKQMDEEREELTRRQANYQSNVDAAVAGVESTVKASGVETCSIQGVLGAAEQKDMSDSVALAATGGGALGEAVTGIPSVMGASCTITANALASTSAAVAVTTSGEVARDAKEFAQYCKEATWRMKTLDELLVKHIDRASERYAKLAQKLADDPRLSALYKNNPTPQTDKYSVQL
ncbi:hypothetical protein, conserved [Trypanosoma brucei brucei TREU927]|uniref:Uncharacterized protein n=1 Tax=Trypanosoma brucei brucei (strain 927/4 GUTat10.1) TaxID=185431 RepID=Q57VW3_TRYB2|nr:hypothetical protein, conserved [Trypanosoma brucei brucei TREU927]AAX70251.1 hypothetical protein, conserved [Trypanosoma brucei]AAZ11165.1 hypothetical protein, conserved [Trypanosoma brucei brucei TREU927]CAQ55528.1 hypothetical protein, conserved [Trypanosoma brucei brucei TREU927]